LYIPLGGSQVSKLINIRSVFVIFLVSGFWHGANWTFIVWGGLHALLFIPSVLTKNNRKFTEDNQLNKYFFPSIGDILRILSTFVAVSFCWVFFRADSLNVAFLFIKNIFIYDSSPISFLNPYDNQLLGIEFI
jgi:alginate O-acetyltransferase complex protein AlgI